MFARRWGKFYVGMGMRNLVVQKSSTIKSPAAEPEEQPGPHFRAVKNAIAL